MGRTFLAQAINGLFSTAPQGAYDLAAGRFEFAGQACIIVVASTA
jgi:hypothetical protein